MIYTIFYIIGIIIAIPILCLAIYFYSREDEIAKRIIEDNKKYNIKGCKELGIPDIIYDDKNHMLL